MWVEHLITQHGKRNIVLVRGPVQQEDSYWREEGYRQALQAHGLPFRDELMLSGEFERECFLCFHARVPGRFTCF